MDLKERLQLIIDENVRLITTDRDLQKFMVSVFALLACIIAYCSVNNGFGVAEHCYGLVQEMLGGQWSYSELGTEYSPVVLLLLIPPALFSFDVTIYCYLFSLYGFAFYMLGGHFMLKSCRETGFSQRHAYVLLFLFFICSLTIMTMSTGPIAAAFVIISLWFYHVRNYNISFLALGIATMAGGYPALLFLFYIISMYYRKNLGDAKVGLAIFAIVCLVFLFIPDTISFAIPEHYDLDSCFGALYNSLGIDVSGTTLVFCGAFLAIVFATCSAVRIKGRDQGMRVPALVTEIALILFVLLSPVYPDQYFVWITMLFPMTQMTSEKYAGQRVTYMALAVFCICSLMCLVTLNSDLHQICVPLRTIALVFLEIRLIREFRTL